MTDIDQRLQVEADRWRAEYLAAGDTVPLVLPGRGRLRPAWRAWTVPVATAAAVAAAVVGTLVVVSRSSGAAPTPVAKSAVPFLDKAVTTLKPGSGTAGDPAAPACALSDFSIGTPVESAVAGGAVLVQAVLTYHGAADCFLSPDGARVTLESKQNDTVVPGPSSPSLPAGNYTPQVGPGRTVILGATWSGDCANADGFSDLRFGFGSDGVSVPLTSGLVPTGACADGRTGLVEHAFAGADAGSPESLLATVTDVPATAAVGDRIDFTVTLTNTTDSAVTFDRCPDYVIVVRQGNGPAQLKNNVVVPGKGTMVGFHSDVLNCAQAPASVPPGGSVAFAMEYTRGGTNFAHARAADLGWAWPSERQRLLPSPILPDNMVSIQLR